MVSNFPHRILLTTIPVDIAWPFGLVCIGILAFFYGTGHIWKKTIITFEYLFMGGRMSLGAIALWMSGHLQKELPRYEYQR